MQQKKKYKVEHQSVALCIFFKSESIDLYERIAINQAIAYIIESQITS